MPPLDSHQQLQSTIDSVRHQIAVVQNAALPEMAQPLRKQVVQDLEQGLTKLQELKTLLGTSDELQVDPHHHQEADLVSASQDNSTSGHRPESGYWPEYCQILERIAQGSSLTEVLCTIVTFIECQLQGACCSVMLATSTEEQGVQLGVAPHLPSDCIQILQTTQQNLSVVVALTRETVAIHDLRKASIAPTLCQCLLDNGIQAYWSTPILSPQGQVLGTLEIYSPEALVLDISSHQRIHQSIRLAQFAIEQHHYTSKLQTNLHQFRSIVEQASVGILITDLQGKIRSANPAVALLLGYNQDELQEFTFKDLTHPAYIEVEAELFTQLVTGVQSSYQIEKRYLPRTGESIWGRVMVHVVQDESGSVLFSFRIVENITQQKRTEAELFNINSKLEQQLAECNQQLLATLETLNATESHLRAILDNVPMGIIIKDLDNRYLIVSRHKLKTTNSTYEDILGRTEYDFFEPSIAAQLQLNDRKVIDAGVPMQFEEVVILEGRTRYCLSVKFPIRNDDGTICGVGGIFLDITDRKQMELALRESETRLHAVLENAPISIIVKDLENRYILVNRYCETTKGVSLGSLIGKTEYETYPPEIAERLILNDYAALAAGKALQFEELIPVKGKLHTCLSIKFPLRNAEGNIDSLCVMFLDITERKTMEIALRNSEARLQAILDNAPLAISVKDLQERLVLVNRHFEIVQGISRHDVVGKTEHAFLPTQAAERIITNDRMTLASGTARKFEEDLPLPGGTRTFISVKFPLRDAEGDPLGLCSMSIDMTERKQAEDALRLSEARLRALINTIPCSIWVRDSRDRLILQNAMDVSYYGDLLGTHVDEASVPDELAQRWMETVSQAKQGTMVRTENVEIIHGQIRHFLSLTAPVPDLAGNMGTLGVSIDITEQKRVQDQLRYSQADLQHRIELEQLITSISTDFINLKFDEIDVEIQSALARIGQFSQIERSYVFSVSKDLKLLQSLHEWCADEVEVCYLTSDPVSMGTLPWSFRHLADGELLSVTHLDELPPVATDEKAFWHSQGIQSLLRVPIILQGQFMGFIGFDSVERTKHWTQATINLLKLVGEIIARALERKDSEYAIRQSEEKYRQAIDNSPNPIFSVNSEGLIQTWNSSCERVFLYTSDIIGQPFELLLNYSEPTDGGFRDKVSSVFKGHIFPSIEIAYRTQNGQECYTISRLYPVRNRYGMVEACVFSNTDITERRRAEEALRQSEATNRALINAIPDLLIRMDRNGRILNIFSNGLMPLHTTDFDVGSFVHEILPPDKAEERMNYVQRALLTGQTQIYEYQLESNGTYYEQEARITVSGEGEVLVMIRDIAARKTAERALEFRVASEELLNQLSGEFMNLSLDEVDQGIVKAIEAIGSFLRLDQVSIHHLSEDQRTLKLTYHWHCSGLEWAQEVDPECLSERSSLPLYELFSTGVSSFPITIGSDMEMTVPMTARGELIGVIRFDAASYLRTWSSEDTNLLTTFTNLLAGLLTRKRTETALRESEELFRSVFENAPVAIGLVKLDYRFSKVNPQMRQLLGLAPSELRDEEIPCPKSLKPPTGELQQLLLGYCSHIRTEKQWIREHDTEHTMVTWVSYTISLIRDHEGQPLYYLGMFEDITARKRAEQALWESRQKYYTLFEAIPLGIAVTDESGYLTETNPAFRKLVSAGLGTYPDYHHQQGNGSIFFTGLSVKELDHPPELMYETSLKYLDDRETWLSITTAPIPLPDYGTVLTYTDITERKQLEQQKDEFIAVVSHELRTPLTSMRALFGLLSAGKLGSLSSQGEQLLKMATSDTDRLERLVNDILTLGRLRAGRLTMSKQLIPIDRIVAQVVQLMSPMANEDQIRIIANTDGGAVWADPDRLIQVLTNLVGNAVKFSPEHGCIWITASSQLTQTVWTVRDQGPGIPPDKLEAIFEPFKQLNKAPHRQKTGTGLGLAICQQILQQHGGRIWAESDEEGSTFSFTLPNLQADSL